MKNFIWLGLILCSNFSYGLETTKELSCSLNGTRVFYVNGVLTSANKNRDDSEFLNDNLRPHSSSIDKKGLIEVEGIFNPSFGIINDAAEFFTQAYYLKTGVYNSKAVYSLVTLAPDVIGSIGASFDKTGFMKAAGFFGYSKALNIASMVSVAEDSWAKAYEKASKNIDSYLIENDVVVSSIGTHIDKARKDKKKVIVVAHSQGNAVAAAGIKKYTSGNQNNYDHLQKYMGLLHVASPAPPISDLPEFSGYKQKNIRLNKDSVISTLDFIPDYPLNTAPVTHQLLSRTDSDLTGHYFAETYVSEKVTVQPLSDPNKQMTMGAVFIDEMTGLARMLEDNCEPEGRIYAYNGHNEYLKYFTLIFKKGNEYIQPTGTVSWDFGDGRVKQSRVFEGATNEYAKNGTYKVKATVKLDDYEKIYELTADVEVSGPVYHYELWRTCQWRQRTVCYGACNLPPDAYDLVNSGMQWTSVNVYDQNNVMVSSYATVEGVYGYSAISYFRDWNDRTGQTYIGFENGDSCPTNALAAEPQMFLYRTIWP